MLLAFFFLIFGKLIMWIFGVPLSMVRIVGGIILMRIGFELFSPSAPGASPGSVASATATGGEDFAFVPLAMPIMFGPGAIATIIGMTSLVKHAEFETIAFIAMCLAIVATMRITYSSSFFICIVRSVCLGMNFQGVDAATRIVGFFVAAIGVGLIFHGVIEAIQVYVTDQARPG